MGWCRPASLFVRTLLAFALLAPMSCGDLSAPDPNNELPFGFIDFPRNGETVGRMVTVTGWALDEKGISTVRLYVNARYRMSAALTVRRPDVSKAFPNYDPREDLHGWHVELDLGEEPGRREILVQAVDKDGATRDLGQVSVTIVSR